MKYKTGDKVTCVWANGPDAMVSRFGDTGTVVFAYGELCRVRFDNGGEGVYHENNIIPDVCPQCGGKNGAK